METAVKERPILFSGEMVRAILDGRKTQTRRVVKPQPDTTHNGEPYWHVGGLRWRPSGQLPIGNNPIACPYGKPGDRLWVRETFAIECNSGLQDAYGEPDNPLGPVRWLTEDDEWETPYFECPRYRASEPDTLLVYLDDFDDEPTMRWRPSIHMPRWASRLTLEVTEVRVERLHRITAADCKAEGIAGPETDTCQVGTTPSNRPTFDRFASLWDSINASKHPWSSNPWVWVVSFKRTEY